MQQTATKDASGEPKGLGIKASFSRKSIKNLQEEVEMIFSQDSDEEMNETNKVPAAVTPPKRRTTRSEQPKTPRLTAVLQESLTPRRSVRKSVKPALDYEDIVATGKRLRSIRSNNAENGVEDREAEEEEAPIWTPAKVGRVSQKRSKRSHKARIDSKKELKELQVEEGIDNAVGEELEAPLVKQAKVEVVPISTEKTEKVDDHMLAVVEKVNEELAALEETQLNKTDVEQLQKSEQNAEVKKDSPKVRRSDLLTAEENTVDDNVIPQVVKVPNGIDEKLTISEKTEENFGSYLKSKSLDVSDLGLNPLEAAELEQKTTEQNEDEEMDSLIIYDEEVDENSMDVMELNELKEAGKEDVQKTAEKKEKTATAAATVNNLNDTFNTSDCYIVSPPTVEETQQKPVASNTVAAADNVDDDVDCFMQPLQLSDDEVETENIAPATKTPKIVLTTAQDLSETLLSAKGLPGTPQSNRPKSYRFPTPYKSKENFKFNKLDNKVGVENLMPSTATIVLSTLEPKEIVLRSIRKRSLSVCIDGRQQLPKRVVNRVTFHSPANQTAVIEDLDALIAKTTKQMALIRQAGDNHVTQRRKRSMSFDESMLSRASKLPIPVVRTITSNNQRQTPQKPVPVASRTKLPNFAAIHQKHFNKMENLVEHVSRKAERAKELSNSALKTARPVSAQKGLPPRNDVNVKLRDKPKASKKIDLLGFTEDLNVNVSTLLPNPRLAIIKPMPAPAIPRKKLVATTTSQVTPSKRVLRPVAQTLAPTATAAAALSKPAFNLSTHVAQAPTLFSAPNTSTAATEDKLAARRKRHMQMFKGRSAESRTTREGVVIRGVRSNRRFELQMQHRRNLEQS